MVFIVALLVWSEHVKLQRANHVQTFWDLSHRAPRNRIHKATEHSPSCWVGNKQHRYLKVTLYTSTLSSRNACLLDYIMTFICNKMFCYILTPNRIYELPAPCEAALVSSWSRYSRPSLGRRILGKRLYIVTSSAMNTYLCHIHRKSGTSFLLHQYRMLGKTCESMTAVTL